MGQLNSGKKFRGNTTAVQCYKCNMFNHSSEFCFMNPRCSICAGQPHYIDCKLPRDSTEIKCCNCGEQHVSSYRGCPKYPKLKPFEKKEQVSNGTGINGIVNNESEFPALSVQKINSKNTFPLTKEKLGLDQYVCGRSSQ